MDASWNPAHIDTTLDSRAATFENPKGARGAGGIAHGGRKGAPSRQIGPGERVTLADVEVFYDGEAEPSVSVPCLDFFGLPHGRPVAYHSALTSANEGRGFNSVIPMPFRQHVRIDYVNAATSAATLYYQVDYTLQTSLPDELGHLHVSFRRENPTVMRRDFVITDDLHGPGRFLGCNVVSA